MTETKTPASDDQSKTQGLDKDTSASISKAQSHIDNKPVFLTVGGTIWKEAPDGEYIARCTKVDPEYGENIYRKLAIYFTIIEGQESGKRARLFYNKKSQEETDESGSDFGLKSKFYTDMKRLFESIIGDGSIPIEIDPVELFLNTHFKITVKHSKKGDAMVIIIDHYLGF